MGKIYPKYVEIFVKKCPGHIQHVSRTFQKMSNKSNFEKTGVIHVWYMRCDSCMVHQVWFMYGTWGAAAAARPPGPAGARHMVYGTWYMVYGIWYMVYGIWYMVYGTWYMVHGIRYTVYGIRYTVYGIRYTGIRVYGNLPIFAKNESAQNCPD